MAAVSFAVVGMGEKEYDMQKMALHSTCLVLAVLPVLAAR